jgi:hypothetical protein
MPFPTLANGTSSARFAWRYIATKWRQNVDDFKPPMASQEKNASTLDEVKRIEKRMHDRMIEAQMERISRVNKKDHGKEMSFNEKIVKEVQDEKAKDEDENEEFKRSIRILRAFYYLRKMDASSSLESQMTESVKISTRIVSEESRAAMPTPPTKSKPTFIKMTRRKITEKYG